jgi:Zn-dependent protease with chaperone function
MQGQPERLTASFFDGVSARQHEAAIWVEGKDLRVRAIGGIERQVPLRDVQWPERQRRGAHTANLPGGAVLKFADADAFHAWAARNGVNESWVIKAQQSWRWTAALVVLLLVLGGVAYEWGVPWGARFALVFVPPDVDRDIGDAAMASIRKEGWLKPSELPADQQAALRTAWARAVAKYNRPGMDIKLHFHKSKMGPNAFALPSGDVVLTDEMVKLVDGREDIVLGVLAHEAGHVRHRHSMRLLAQAALLGTITTVAFGDFSGLLAGAPALLGHLGYSRDLEREADDESIALLRANGISPEVMAIMFERLQKFQREKGMPDLPIALGSHPSDAERIARFRKAAGHP